MKKSSIYYIVIVLLIFFAQESHSQEDRIAQIQQELESIVVDAPGLNEKVDINVSNIDLPGFLRGLGNAHELNINIDPQLNNIIVTNNFSNATVSDILVFLAKKYELDIDFTGNILSIKKHIKEKKSLKIKEIPITYDKDNDLLSIDLKQDTLYRVFKEVTDKTGENLVFAPGLENTKLTSYIQQMPFHTAMDKIAFANNLIVTKTRDNYYLFETATTSASNNQSGTSKNQQQPRRNRRSNFYLKVLDTVSKKLDVDFENTPISNIIYDIGQQFKLNVFTSSPLDAAGNATVKAKDISVDLLLDKILENTDYAFKTENNIYYFGKRDQASLQNTVTIPLLHRSIEILRGQSSGGNQLNTYGQTSSSFNGNNLNRGGTFNNSSNNNRQNVNTNSSSFQKQMH